jgi:hypothetical protein
MIKKKFSLEEVASNLYVGAGKKADTLFASLLRKQA